MLLAALTQDKHPVPVWKCWALYVLDFETAHDPNRQGNDPASACQALLEFVKPRDLALPEKLRALH